MTSSVVTSRDCGMVSPIALATLRLITCLRRAGCSTGIRRLCTVQYLVGVASSPPVPLIKGTIAASCSTKVLFAREQTDFWSLVAALHAGFGA